MIRVAERRFYLGMALALLAALIIGFARTFFFKAWFPEWAAAHGAREGIFYVHGTVFTAWYVLLVAQASLIGVRRVAVHRRVGFAGVAVAVLVAALGVAASLIAAGRPTGFIDVPVSALEFLTVPLGIVFLYVVFTALAFSLRRDVQAHKRYMLLTSIVMIEAAVTRWPFAFMSAASPVPFLDMSGFVTDLFLLPMIVWDLRSRGRLHVVTLWAGLALIGFHALRMPLGSTAGWQAFAGWAVRLLGSS
jgi:hypothetical protein